MLTGTPGVGGFLWQEYNSLVYSHIILSVLTIGAIGFLLDRLMGPRRGARPGPLMAYLEVRDLRKAYVTPARPDGGAGRSRPSPSTKASSWPSSGIQAPARPPWSR
jgi:hypothetical protein